MFPRARSRGYLPHLEGENPIYFVTFRLADSLPRELLAQLRQEREMLKKARQAGTQVRADLIRQEKLRALLRKAERFLDGGLGACHMRDQRIARIVAGAIRHFEGERYRLLAWCVMPNHVHVVFSPIEGNTLETIVHSWKSFSAQAANRLLRRSGTFWQREYFDHLVRNEASVARILRYVQQNPLKAGLHNWPWVGSHSVPPAFSRP
jgi:REP element-mobilizing transposase RayT